MTNAALTFRDLSDFLVTTTEWRDGGGAEGAEGFGPLADVDINAPGRNVVTTSVAKSDGSRGLALKEFMVNEPWDKLRALFTRRKNETNQVYFLSFAFDLSGEPPEIMPPKEVQDRGRFFVDVPWGESFKFTLGEGAPLFLPRQVHGGIGLYLMLCEADNAEKIGKKLDTVHQELKGASASFLDLVKQVVTDPTGVIVSKALNAGFDLLAPIIKLLGLSEDDYVGIAQGTFPARKEWEGRLTQYFPDGSYLKLAEISE